MLSDRFDRRRVLVVCCLLTASAALAVAFVGSRSLTLVFVLTAVYCGFAATIYPTSVAHANDFVDPADMVGAAGGMLLGYSLGAMAGPLVASQMMAMAGPAGLFLFTAMVGAGLGLFGLWRMTRRATLPSDQQGPWVQLPRTTPVAYELEPWAEAADGQPAENQDQGAKT